MPIYEYLCRDCSHKFELKQSRKDDPVAVCDRCGKTVSRIISPPAIMFKGTGWYVTDYSDKLKPPTADAASTPANAKKEGTADSPPAPAAPAATATSTAPSGGGTSAPASSGSTPSSSGNSSSST